MISKTLVAAGTILVGLAIILLLRADYTSFALEAQDDEQAFNYACGYRAGQNSVMVRLGNLVKPDDIVPMMIECEPYRRHAAKHGFKGD